MATYSLTGVHNFRRKRIILTSRYAKPHDFSVHLSGNLLKIGPLDLEYDNRSLQIYTIETTICLYKNTVLWPPLFTKKYKRFHVTVPKHAPNSYFPCLKNKILRSYLFKERYRIYLPPQYSLSYLLVVLIFHLVSARVCSNLKIYTFATMSISQMCTVSSGGHAILKRREKRICGLGLREHGRQAWHGNNVWASIQHFHSFLP